jgi:hypothetical protein
MAIGFFGDKVIRVILILTLVLVLFWGVQFIKKLPVSFSASGSKIVIWMMAIAFLLVLASTGKLNWLFAMLGLLIASLVRWMPLLLKHAPALHRLWLMFGANKSYQEQGPKPGRGSHLSPAEALEVLGLKSGASREDIILAHRKLIAKLHPDKGGSDYLAAQINLAKKILLDS